MKLMLLNQDGDSINTEAIEKYAEECEAEKQKRIKSGIFDVSEKETINIIKQMVSMFPNHFSCRDIEACGVDDEAKRMVRLAMQYLIDGGEILLDDKMKLVLKEEL